MRDFLTVIRDQRNLSVGFGYGICIMMYRSESVRQGGTFHG